VKPALCTVTYTSIRVGCQWCSTLNVMFKLNLDAPNSVMGAGTQTQPWACCGGLWVTRRHLGAGVLMLSICSPDPRYPLFRRHLPAGRAGQGGRPARAGAHRQVQVRRRPAAALRHVGALSLSLIALTMTLVELLEAGQDTSSLRDANIADPQGGGTDSCCGSCQNYDLC